VVLTALLLAFFAGAYALSLGWPYRSALFPRLVSATGVLLTVLHLIALAVRGRRAAAALGTATPPAAAALGTATPPAAAALGTATPPASDDEDEEHGVEYVFASAGGRAWSAALAWIAGFFASLWLLGAAPTVPAFALLYLRLAGGTSWRAAAVYAVGAGVAVSAVLGRLLSVPLPTGVL
jgi:hypothetical protein